jgi:hypothetical protein
MCLLVLGPPFSPISPIPENQTNERTSDAKFLPVRRAFRRQSGNKPPPDSEPGGHRHPAHSGGRRHGDPLTLPAGCPEAGQRFPAIPLKPLFSFRGNHAGFLPGVLCPLARYKQFLPSKSVRKARKCRKISSAHPIPNQNTAMNTIPLQIHLGHGERARVVTVRLTIPEIRRMQGLAVCAGVTAKEWLAGELMKSIDLFTATPPPPAPSPEISRLPFPFLPDERPRP